MTATVDRAVSSGILVAKPSARNLLRLEGCDFWRAIWAVAMIFGGTFPLIHHFGPDSCLHHSRWPGYPEGWQALWYGRLWHLRLPDETKRVRSRRLMRAGVVELANLCNADAVICVGPALEKRRSTYSC